MGEVVIFGAALPRFELGRVVMTLGARDLLEAHYGDPVPPAMIATTARAAIELLLARHRCGDWGEVPSEDATSNEEAVREGERILSSYTLSCGHQDSCKVDDHRVWVITEADRSVTTLLLPADY